MTGRSIFGWSLPPGCTNSDIDNAYGHEGPCQKCGKDETDCECAECPECSMFGCLEHTTPADLYATKARFAHVVSSIDFELKRRNLPLIEPYYDEPDLPTPDEEPPL